MHLCCFYICSFAENTGFESPLKFELSLKLSLYTSKLFMHIAKIDCEFHDVETMS